MYKMLGDARLGTPRTTTTSTRSDGPRTRHRVRATETITREARTECMSENAFCHPFQILSPYCLFLAKQLLLAYITLTLRHTTLFLFSINSTPLTNLYSLPLSLSFLPIFNSGCTVNLSPELNQLVCLGQWSVCRTRPSTRAHAPLACWSCATQTLCLQYNNTNKQHCLHLTESELTDRVICDYSSGRYHEATTNVAKVSLSSLCLLLSLSLSLYL